jgi:hypothetical protein
MHRLPTCQMLPEEYSRPHSNFLKPNWISRRRRQANQASSQQAMWLSSRSSSKKATHPRQPSSARAWVTNRNSRSSVSCGLTETYSYGNHDMPGVPKELIEHSLNVYPQVVPKKQRLRRFAPDKWEAIKQEIAKLLAAGFIKEVIHLEWVANPVLVLKKNKEWRMCVDYTDLNKHCPKDHFGLPRIDQVVDSTAG